MTPLKLHQVSHHAARRYYERVHELPKDSSMTSEMIAYAQKRILSSIDMRIQEAIQTLKNGKFPTTDGMVAIVRNSVVVTMINGKRGKK